MPFDVMIKTNTDGDFNWFDTPDSFRGTMESLAERFRTGNYEADERLVFHRGNDKFDKRWGQITSFVVAG